MKKKIYFLGILFIFLVPFRIFAEDTVSLSLTCDENKKVGETVTCTLSVSNLSYESASFTGMLEGFSGATVSGKLSLSETALSGSEITEGGTIATITGSFAEAKEYTIKVTGKFSDGTNETDELTASATVTISSDTTGGDTEPSENSGKLSKLLINESTEDENLSQLKCTEGSKACYFSIPNDLSSFKVEAVPVDTNDKVKIFDNRNSYDSGATITYNTNDGVMILRICVGLEPSLVDGTEGPECNSSSKEYLATIQKTRSNEPGETPEVDNKLATLVVGGVTVDLPNCTQEESNSWVCEVTVANVEGNTVVATLSDPDNFKFDEGNPSGINGGEGNTVTGSFIISIVPKDSSSGIVGSSYTINVTGTEKPNEKENDVPVTPPTPSSNPNTGSTSIFIITMLLILSFVASIYIYKKNIQGYNN